MNELTLSTALETALARIEDMLAGDDGQAFKEARKFLPAGRAVLAAQPGSVGEPVKWAMCTETETPCSACPTAGTPCQARTERSRDFGDLIFALDQWKAAPPGNQSTVALNRLEAVIADLAAAPTEAKPAQDAVDAERDAL